MLVAQTGDVEMEGTKPWPSRVPTIFGVMGKNQTSTKQPTTAVMGTTRPVEPAQGGQGGLPGGSWTEGWIGEGRRKQGQGGEECFR